MARALRPSTNGMLWQFMRHGLFERQVWQHASPAIPLKDATHGQSTVAHGLNHVALGSALSGLKTSRRLLLRLGCPDAVGDGDGEPAALGLAMRILELRLSLVPAAASAVATGSA